MPSRRRPPWTGLSDHLEAVTKALVHHGPGKRAREDVLDRRRATDALGHRVHRPAPPTHADVDEMLAATELVGTDHRGAPDLAGIRDCVRRVARLGDVLPMVAEIDVDPLVVAHERSVALDVRVRVVPGAE